MTRYAIEIPYALSILAYGDPNATVKGLNEFPADEHPPVAIVHIAFQIMVACGLAMMALALWGAWRWWRARRKKSETWLDSRWFLRTLVAAAPLGFIAIETGWVVTEVGRQPWIIYGVMRTQRPSRLCPDSSCLSYLHLLYIFLAAITVWLLLRTGCREPACFHGRDG